MRKGEAYTGFWWGYLRKEPLGRPRSKWENNTEMGVYEVE
jgi:hypothetical protein